MQTVSYITTPLYYVNARPHLGHYYTTLLADVIKRHQMQRGIQTTLLTGTDEHGEKMEQMAKQNHKAPKEFVDEIAEDYKKTWDALELEYDIFFRTTQKDHSENVQRSLQKLKDKGDIVFREYEGHYCVGCERFLTESELTDKGLCPDHLTKPEARKEANYFFLMSRYKDALIQHIEKHPDFIQPEQYRSETLSFLKQELGDLCISRPKSRLTWGIELPFDTNFVTYVWFDALLNYVHGIGYPDSFDKKLWNQCTHLIGKDILKTHAIYWTTMLLALEIPPYKTLQVGGYLLIGGSKMSKTVGNVVLPLEMETQYGRETLRFFLLKDMSYGFDSSFTLEGFTASVNAHLANGIGNLVSRVLTLCLKNFKGTFSESKLTEQDHKVLDLRKHTLDAWNQSFKDLKYQNALKSWCELVSQVDLYVNDNKPWALAKDPSQADRLETVLGVCLQMIKALAVLVYPVLPHASKETLTALGISSSKYPDIKLITENAKEFHLKGEVPKLFMRIS